MQKTSAATGVTEDVASMKIGVDVVLEQPAQLAPPPSKLHCVLSLRNEFEVHLHGVLQSTNTPSLPTERAIVVRSLVRLPVKWDCIEVYPFTDPDHWKEEYAPFWAENDILSQVVAKQFHEQQFENLDRKASARRQSAELLKNYRDLLDSNPEREEILQSFLKDNPALLCPTQIRAWPKLRLEDGSPISSSKTLFVITYWLNLRNLPIGFS